MANRSRADRKVVSVKVHIMAGAFLARSTRKAGIPVAALPWPPAGGWPLPMSVIFVPHLLHPPADGPRRMITGAGKCLEAAAPATILRAGPSSSIFGDQTVPSWHRL